MPAIPHKDRTPACRPGLRPGAGGDLGCLNYNTDCQPRQDPFCELFIQALSRMVQAGLEAEAADQAGDRERFWAARRRFLLAQAELWRVMQEVGHGRQ